MKKSTKTLFQIVIYLLLGISIFSSLIFVLYDLNVEEATLCLKILGASSILNTFIWFYYELKNAPIMEEHE
jgi:hypothetical protein